MGRYRYNGGRLRVSGARAIHADCCCSPYSCCASAATDDEIRDCIYDAGYDAEVVIESGDYSENASCDNCDSIAGTYTLLWPPGGATPFMQWLDDFAKTICGASSTLRVTVEVTPDYSAGTFFVRASAGVTVGFTTTSSCVWEDTITATCEEFMDAMTTTGYSLPATNRSTSLNCYTQTSDGSVVVKFV